MDKNKYITYTTKMVEIERVIGAKERCLKMEKKLFDGLLSTYHITPEELCSDNPEDVIEQHKRIQLLKAELSILRNHYSNLKESLIDFDL